MKIKSTRPGAVSAFWSSTQGLAMMLTITLATFLTGCGAYIGGDYGGGYVGDYGGGDGGYGNYDDGGDMYLFGGDYGRGRDVQAYSHRGAESRGAAHLSGGHFGGGGVGGAHAGGGHGVGGAHGGGGGGRR